MTTVLNFYINHFIDKIKRDHEIIFIHNDKNDTLYINFELVSQYTDFFKPKLGLLVDNVYETPFEIDYIIDCFEHLHNLFKDLNTSGEKLFKLLNVFDYFCIDMEEIYEYIVPKITHSDIMLNTWTKDVITNGSDFALKLINMLYDKRYATYSYIYSIDKDVLLFLLKRKWLVTNIDREIFQQRASLLEFYLFQSILHYIDQPNRLDNTNKNEEFIELWKYIHPSLLSKEALLSFSNHRLAKLVYEELVPIIHQKLQIFSSFTILQSSRFFIEIKHLYANDIKLGQKIQAMDRKQRWYNAVVIDVNDSTIEVSFDNFTSRYNEIISKDENFRFLPFNSLIRDNICPCECCISKIFSAKNNINII